MKKKENFFSFTVWPHETGRLRKAGEPAEIGKVSFSPEHMTPPPASMRPEHVTFEGSPGYSQSFGTNEKRHPSGTGGFDGQGTYTSGYTARPGGFYSDKTTGKMWVFKPGVDTGDVDAAWKPRGSVKDAHGAGYGAKLEHTADKLVSFFATPRNGYRPLPSYLYSDATGERIPDGTPAKKGEPVFRVIPHLGPNSSGMGYGTPPEIVDRLKRGSLVDAFFGLGDQHGGNVMYTNDPDSKTSDGPYRIDMNNGLGRRARGYSLLKTGIMGQNSTERHTWHDTSSTDFLTPLANHYRYNFRGVPLRYDPDHELKVAQDMIDARDADPKGFEGVFDHLTNKEEHLESANLRFKLLNEMVKKYKGNPEAMRQDLTRKISELGR